MCQSDMGDPVEIHIHVELEHTYYNQGCWRRILHTHLNQCIEWLGCMIESHTTIIMWCDEDLITDHGWTTPHKIVEKNAQNIFSPWNSLTFFL